MPKLSPAATTKLVPNAVLHLDGAGPQTYIFDTFTESANTVLPSHSPDIDVGGGGWSSLAGSFQVIASTDVLYPPSAGAKPFAAVIDATKADCTITMDCHNISATRSLEVTIRAVDIDNQWRILVSPASNTVAIYERTSGTNTLRASAAITWADDYTMKVVLSGTTITVTHNGATTVSYSSAVRQTATKHGVGANNTFTTGNAWCDNFKVVA